MRRDQLFGTAYLSSKSTLFPLFFIKHFHLQASKQMNAAANQLLLCCFVLFEVCRVALCQHLVQNIRNAKVLESWAAAIAQWIRLRLPTCGPGSNPKHI